MPDSPHTTARKLTAPQQAATLTLNADRAWADLTDRSFGASTWQALERRDIVEMDRDLIRLTEFGQQVRRAITA